MEAQGGQYSHASKAEISISEPGAHQDAFYRLTRLPNQLPWTCGDEPLSLAEAQTLYNSRLFDTLCSILKRLKWTYFCNDLHSLVCPRGGFLVAGSALDGIAALLGAYRRVQPPSRHARLETFGRYWLWATGNAYSPSWVTAYVPRSKACFCPFTQSIGFRRFQSMIPSIHSTVLAFADILLAVAETGVRAHAGYLVLAKVTLSLLQARQGPLVSQHNYLALSASGMLSMVWPRQ